MSYESETKKIFCKNLILSALTFAIQWIIKCTKYTKVYSVYRIDKVQARVQARVQGRVQGSKVTIVGDYGMG